MTSEWELPLNEDLKKLGKFSKAVVKGNRMYIHNGKANKKPIIFTYDDSTQELYKTIDVNCRAALVKTGEYPDDLIARLCVRLLNALEEYVKQRAQQQYESQDLIGEDEKKPKRYYIHKYSKGIPLAEALIVADQPCFIQMQDGLSGDFNLPPEIPIDENVLLCPKDIHSYLSAEYQAYVFEDKDEIKHYLRLAKHFGFDRIFELVKTIVKKYVVAEDHYITLITADIIYSYFQDHFGTTHYHICVGSNGAGKNSILMTFASLGYRVLLATNVSGANVYTYLGTQDECQGTIAEDEISTLDKNSDKMNIYKSGYSRGSGRVPKIDLESGRSQGLFHSYCFKIFASEESLDNSAAKGFLDRSFEILCIVGKPDHNIKEVWDACNSYLKNELLKTRKLLFAKRMLLHDKVIADVELNIFNREAELTKPLIRLFQDSPDVLKELLPALTKCLDAKRNVKSTSKEAYLYTTITNLVAEHGFELSNESIQKEMMRITGGVVDIPGRQEFYCQDLGKVTFGDITKTLVSKFKAERIYIGSGENKKRGLRFTKENLNSKSIEYNAPSNIEILSTKQPLSGPDAFDRIIGTVSENAGTPGTVTETTVPENEHDGTPGTAGTPVQGISDKYPIQISGQTYPIQLFHGPQQYHIEPLYGMGNQTDSSTIGSENNGQYLEKGVPSVPAVPASSNSGTV